MVRLIILVGILVASTFASEIENPGFFLKVSKNVPRIGRRSDGQSDFNMMYMHPKNIPQPNRRSQLVSFIWMPPESILDPHSCHLRTGPTPRTAGFERSGTTTQHMHHRHTIMYSPSICRWDWRGRLAIQEIGLVRIIRSDSYIDQGLLKYSSSSTWSPTSPSLTNPIWNSSRGRISTKPLSRTPSYSRSSTNWARSTGQSSFMTYARTNPWYTRWALDRMPATNTSTIVRNAVLGQWQAQEVDSPRIWLDLVTEGVYLRTSLLYSFSIYIFIRIK